MIILLKNQIKWCVLNKNEFGNNITNRYEPYRDVINYGYMLEIS